MKKVQKRRKGIKAKFSVRGAKHLIVKMKSKLRLKNAAKIAIYKLATAPRTKNRLKRRVWRRNWKKWLYLRLLIKVKRKKTKFVRHKRMKQGGSRRTFRTYGAFETRHPLFFYFYRFFQELKYNTPLNDTLLLFYQHIFDFSASALVKKWNIVPSLGKKKFYKGKRVTAFFFVQILLIKKSKLIKKFFFLKQRRRSKQVKRMLQIKPLQLKIKQRSRLIRRLLKNKIRQPKVFHSSMSITRKGQWRNQQQLFLNRKSRVVQFKRGLLLRKYMYVLTGDRISSRFKTAKYMKHFFYFKKQLGMRLRRKFLKRRYKKWLYKQGNTIFFFRARRALQKQFRRLLRKQSIAIFSMGKKKIFIKQRWYSRQKRAFFYGAYWNLLAVPKTGKPVYSSQKWISPSFKFFKKEAMRFPTGLSVISRVAGNIRLFSFRKKGFPSGVFWPEFLKINRARSVKIKKEVRLSSRLLRLQLTKHQIYWQYLKGLYGMSNVVFSDRKKGFKKRPFVSETSRRVVSQIKFLKKVRKKNAKQLLRKFCFRRRHSSKRLKFIQKPTLFIKPIMSVKMYKVINKSFVKFQPYYQNKQRMWFNKVADKQKLLRRERLPNHPYVVKFKQYQAAVAKQKFSNRTVRYGIAMYFHNKQNRSNDRYDNQTYTNNRYENKQNYQNRSNNRYDNQAYANNRYENKQNYQNRSNNRYDNQTYTNNRYENKQNYQNRSNNRYDNQTYTNNRYENKQNYQNRSNNRYDNQTYTNNRYENKQNYQNRSNNRYDNQTYTNNRYENKQNYQNRSNNRYENQTYTNNRYENKQNYQNRSTNRYDNQAYTNNRYENKQNYQNRSTNRYDNQAYTNNRYENKQNYPNRYNKSGRMSLPSRRMQKRIWKKNLWKHKGRRKESLRKIYKKWEQRFLYRKQFKIVQASAFFKKKHKTQYRPFRKPFFGKRWLRYQKPTGLWKKYSYKRPVWRGRYFKKHKKWIKFHSFRLIIRRWFRRQLITERWSHKGAFSKFKLYRNFLRWTCQRKRYRLFYNRYQQELKWIPNRDLRKFVRKRKKLFTLKILLRKLLKWVYQSDQMLYIWKTESNAVKYSRQLEAPISILYRKNLKILLSKMPKSVCYYILNLL